MGDVTSELRPSESISEFLSDGPKNYKYMVLTRNVREKTVCKVKGITVNYYASKMVMMILRGNTGDESYVVNVRTDKKIKRNRAEGGTVSIAT